MELGKFDFDNGEEVVTIDLDALLKVSDDLSTEFKQQAANYAYLAMIAAQAEMLYMNSKHDEEVTLSQVYKRVRKEKEALGEKSTEAAIKAEVDLDKSCGEAAVTTIYARAQHSLLKALVTAMEMKANMLISLGAHNRAELSATGMNIATDVKKALGKYRQQVAETTDVAEGDYKPPF